MLWRCSEIQHSDGGNQKQLEIIQGNGKTEYKRAEKRRME